jgi:paraquat-inducible protein B
VTRGFDKKMPSLIWLVPLIAALIGITLVARVLLERGPRIEVSFRTAEGLEAGKTVVKYKEVQIGVVQSLRLSSDRSHVRVVLQLDQDAEGFAARDTRFWVVRPRLDTTGISGLGTLLSGAYIGADAGSSSENSRMFVGLEAPPVVTHGAPGTQFLLHAEDAGSLGVGSPVFLRRIKVGQVAAYELERDGRSVLLRIFVNAPYDAFVGVNTRFWHASGFDLRLSASGATLRTQSLTSILLGGIAFGAPDEARGPTAPEGTAFALAGDESTAMKTQDGPAQTLLLYFNQSLRGLSPGAAVDFRGVVIGEVKAIGAEFDRGQREFRMPVLVRIYPGRLRPDMAEPGHGPAREQEDVKRVLIGKGLRAQLRSANLLTGQLYVALDFFPKAPAVTIDVTREPLELPTIPSGLDTLQSQVEEIVSKVNKVPFAQIGNDLRTTLASLDKTLTSAEQLTTTLNNDVAPEAIAAMKDARKTMSAVERTLAQDSPLQQDARQTLQELTRTAASVRVLTDYLERHPESLLRGKPDDKK